MQAYSQGFARVYNMRWADFARRVAPLILSFYESTPAGQANKTLLDLCCGTGHLAVHFLEQGYRVVGLDLSQPMLGYAAENAKRYVAGGQARFVHGDAARFSLDERFGLVVSTYDSLNHLPDESALHRCFQSVFAALEQDGVFIFDLNTRAGLNRWNSISVEDSHEELMIITRGIYDGQSDRAWTKISGFVRTDMGLYERFDETAFNTVFGIEKVRNALVEMGWRRAFAASVQDLAPIAEPEREGRVFIVAHK